MTTFAEIDTFGFDMSNIRINVQYNNIMFNFNDRSFYLNYTDIYEYVKKTIDITLTTFITIMQSNYQLVYHRGKFIYIRFECIIKGSVAIPIADFKEYKYIEQIKIVKEVEKDAVKEVAKDVVKEVEKDAIKGVAKDVVKEVEKDAIKGVEKDAIKGVEKDAIKGVAKDVVKEVEKDSDFITLSEDVIKAWISASQGGWISSRDDIVDRIIKGKQLKYTLIRTCKNYKKIDLTHIDNNLYFKYNKDDYKPLTVEKYWDRLCINGNIFKFMVDTGIYNIIKTTYDGSYEDVPLIMSCHLVDMNCKCKEAHGYIKCTLFIKDGMISMNLDSIWSYDQDKDKIYMFENVEKFLDAANKKKCCEKGFTTTDAIAEILGGEKIDTDFSGEYVFRNIILKNK
jgi:hypothetical protein